jgi:hypothetical protein
MGVLEARVYHKDGVVWSGCSNVVLGAEGRVPLVVGVVHTAM